MVRQEGELEGNFLQLPWHLCWVDGLLECPCEPKGGWKLAECDWEDYKRGCGNKSKVPTCAGHWMRI